MSSETQRPAAEVLRGEVWPAVPPANDQHDLELRYRSALLLWLRWNEAHEQATSQIFAGGQDVAKVREFMDMLDQLRFQAIAASHELLD